MFDESNFFYFTTFKKKIKTGLTPKIWTTAIEWIRKCELLNLNRSSACYRLNYSKQKEKEQKDLEIKEQIKNIQMDFPYCGNLTIAAELKRQGKNINKKKVQRIMQKYQTQFVNNYILIHQSSDFPPSKITFSNYL